MLTLPAGRSESVAGAGPSAMAVVVTLRLPTSRATTSNSRPISQKKTVQALRESAFRLVSGLRGFRMFRTPLNHVSQPFMLHA